MMESDRILFEQFKIDKHSSEYLSVFTNLNPKVSVVITTYNAGEMLVGHSLKSVLNQTYKNLEIIIIGDGCTDNTEELVKNVNDPRIIFENKIHEPVPVHNSWGLIGASAINRGLQLCTGSYVAHLDDDDVFLPTKIEKLVNFNLHVKADVIHHPFKIYYLYKHPDYPELFPEAVQYQDPEIFESKNYMCGHVATSTMFYHRWFSKVLIDMNNLPGEPGDWNKSRRMQEIGAKIERYPEILSILSKNLSHTTGRNMTKPWIEES